MCLRDLVQKKKKKKKKTRSSWVRGGEGSGWWLSHKQSITHIKLKGHCHGNFILFL